MKDMTDENMNAWMDGFKVSTSQALPSGKGIIAEIHEPKQIETKFGKRNKVQFVINGSDGSTIHVGMFLPQQFPMVHPKSNLGKIMALHSCKGLKDLLGKEVEVIETGDMMWKIKVE